MKIVLFLMVIAFAIPVSAADGGFLFTTFRDEATPTSEQIYMGISEDGRRWNALNDGKPVLLSDVGEKGVRDSFLLRSHDGQKVWLIATDLCIARNSDWKRATHSGSRSIVVWETSDLVHWTPPRLAKVAPEDAGCVWAPEAIYDQDARDYLVYWASTTGRDNFAKQRIWAAHTKDFRSFDKPFIFCEKANHVIDIDIVKDGETYYRFTKDDKVKSISMASSKKLTGPWQEMPQFTAGLGKNFEGPLCFRLSAAADGRPPVWCLLLDDVSDRIGSGAVGYMPFVSNDLSTGQFTPGKDFHFPFPFRHGSVLPITTAERDQIKSAMPVKAVELKSGLMKSGNPIFPGWYADPEAKVFGQEYWIYPTYSAPYDQQTFFDAFSSPDLVHWTKHSHILDTKAVTWAHRALWAPAVAEQGGRYFFFFAANDIQNDRQLGGIGVAVADHPQGPFKDYLGKPLIAQFHHGAQPIDPFVFRDDDGQSYLIYGGWRHCNIGRLKKDFTGFEPFADGSQFKEITPAGYVEGSVMLRRQGKYYFMWSEGNWTGPDYSVAYAMADSPTGPYKRIGKILQQDAAVATGAGHHSVIKLPGKEIYYIVYHRRPLGESDGNHRVTCIDRMEFDEQGFIKPVKITFEGVPPVKLLTAKRGAAGNKDTK